MNDKDLQQILWHKDRRIERLEAIVEDQQQLIAIMEDKLNLVYLENTILQGEKEYDAHREQVRLEL
jgi:hypothetical protein